jgi:O-methyltransferase
MRSTVSTPLDDQTEFALMTIYGPRSPEDMALVERNLHEVKEVYDRNEISVFAGDNMMVFGRYLTFARDKAFMDAFQNYAIDAEDNPKIWRVHTFCWAARTALAREGDFVECGVYKGLYSATMCRALDFGTSGRQLYLYDTFEGLAEKYSTPEELEAINKNYHNEGLHDLVLERFADYQNVTVVKGIVPDAFDVTAPEKIAFLHVDLNAASAEIAVLEALLNRVVPGGVILLDDFARQDMPGLCEAHFKWWTEQGVQVLELPTGQGLVIKP